jgi:hypothetical protein
MMPAGDASRREAMPAQGKQRPVSAPDRNETIAIRAARPALRRHLAMYLLAAGGTLGAGAAALALLQGTGVRGSVILVPALALFLVALMVVLAARAAIALRALGIAGPVVTLGPSGIRDRRISPRELPWSDLEWRYSHAHRRGNLTLYCRHPVSVWWPYRIVSGPRGAASGGRPVWLSCTDLECGTEEMAALLARFHPGGRLEAHESSGTTAD